MRATSSLGIAVALSVSCATPQLDGGPGSPVLLQTPAEVGWEPGGPDRLPLTLLNASGHRLVLVKPRPEAVQVKVFRPDGSMACKTPRPSDARAEGWEARALLASQELGLVVDVSPYCRDLAVGVYRYEVTFLANQASMSEAMFTGLIGPQGGRLAVGAGLSSDAAALGTVLAGGLRAEPPRPAVPAPQSSEAAIACIDRELAARGLNAYGDPQGTTYPGGPPAEEGGRALYVAGRNGEIRAACGIRGF